MTTKPIDRDTAIEIAKRAAADRGYPWIEPTYAIEKEGMFHISSNAMVLGGNVLVIVDRTTGDVQSIETYLK